MWCVVKRMGEVIRMGSVVCCGKGGRGDKDGKYKGGVL